jgi:hypothetical protein
MCKWSIEILPWTFNNKLTIFFIFVYHFDTCTCITVSNSFAKFRKKNVYFIQTNSYIIFTCPIPVILVLGFSKWVSAKTAIWCNYSHKWVWNRNACTCIKMVDKNKKNSQLIIEGPRVFALTHLLKPRTSITGIGQVKIM